VIKSDEGNARTAMTHKSLQVEQLIYTSFRRSGFALLKSANIPADVQQVFLSQTVHTYWDTYSPPKPPYRAAYLHQFPLTSPGTLFGWLYHDGQDEFGRSDVPYFIAYYVPNLLQASQLSQILACLQQGPVEWLDRLEQPPNEIQPLSLGNTQDYSAARQGVELPALLRVESYHLLESQSLMNWFHAEPDAADQPRQNENLSLSITHPLQRETVNAGSDLGELTVNVNNLSAILKQLVAKPGIQGTALVSAEGQAIIAPIGIDENTVGILSGTMLCLLQSTQEELHWQNIETVSIQSQEGYLILKHCGTDMYLLIRSDKVPLGLLEGEVSRAVNKLQAELNFVSGTSLTATETQSATLIQFDPIPNSTSMDTAKSASLNSVNEVTYRGRRTSL
jgi:predicted regulator of Ras-like GTPase activity (Roadblock/LC7/MglB family)